MLNWPYNVRRTAYHVGSRSTEVERFSSTAAVKDEWMSKDGITKLRFTDILEDGKPAVYNPTIVYGTTTVFENQFSWRLKDS
ncbi:MAG: hypothetical protein WCT54_04310, partial [Patescibacteria group bacterium]